MATVQLFHHKISLPRQSSWAFKAMGIVSAIAAIRQFYTIALAALKPGSKQLINLMLEGLVQNLFGQHISKAFLVLLLQSYCLPVLKMIACRTRQLAMLKGIAHRSDAGSSFKPCFN